jgi:methyl coenzyme M reductase subunit D
MNHGELTAVIIVAIVMIASIIRASVRGPRHPVIFGNTEGHAENQRLRDEVSQLKERLKVIERITVEKENSLSREIDSLRDR